MPRGLDRRPLRAVPIQQRVFGAAPARAAIVYRDEHGEVGFVAERDRRRFFRQFFAMIATAARIPWRFGRVRRAYRAAYPAMVSEHYWRAQFAPGSHPPARVAAPKSA